MALIQNSSTIKEIRTSAGLSISEGFPSKIADLVMPVINVNPKDYKIDTVLGANASAATGHLTIFTASTTRATYITGLDVSAIKNATNDTGTGFWSITCVINGQSQSLLNMAILTLTAQVWDKTVVFKNPILIDKGSLVRFFNSAGGDYTSGAAYRACAVYGYEVEPFENI